MASLNLKVGKGCLFIFILLLLAEFFLRFEGIRPAFEHHLVTKPFGFFEADSLLGWKNKGGNFILSKSDSRIAFEATLDSEGCRITSNKQIPKKGLGLPVVHIYGCEYTFGFSVLDSATSSFQLQKLLPQFKVSNKAVIAYGLTQMFLSLQQSLGKGDTPTIAIFNYGSFQDVRYPFNRTWNSLLEYSLEANYASDISLLKYPYTSYHNDSALVNYVPFNKRASWSIRDKIALINFFYSMYERFSDRRTCPSYLHRISEKTALDIMQYCKQHHIIAVFANLTPESKDILQTLSAKGYYTLDYGLTVLNDEDMPNKYNCGSLDPQHPNALAHSIYAQKIYSLLQSHNLITPH